MSTKINEWKILSDGSVRAKVRGKGEEGAEHFILSFCYAVDRSAVTFWTIGDAR